ncbi:hypothetical protein OL548_12745 [Lysinibacillus sp. MHQ-1]|nr:hypothetical protein OL548_12745 [Lysinibacillus sp. MHQ-1]
MPLKVEQKEEVKELTMEQQALNLAKQGKSTEEIAKQLQKGKNRNRAFTEISSLNCC